MAFKHFCDRCGNEIMPSNDYFLITISKRYRIEGIPIPTDPEKEASYDVCGICATDIRLALGVNSNGS